MTGEFFNRISQKRTSCPLLVPSFAKRYIDVIRMNNAQPVGAFMHRVFFGIFSVLELLLFLTAPVQAGDQKNELRYPDVWCRTLPLSAQSLNAPTRISDVYMNVQNHPVVSYVLRLNNIDANVRKSIVRYYDFYSDKVIGEYYSICEKINECYTSEGINTRDYGKSIRDKHGLRRLRDIFHPLNPGVTRGVYNESSPKDSRTISYREVSIPDGGRLRRTSSHGGLYPLSTGLQKIDINGRELFHVMLVRVTKAKHWWHSNSENPYWEGRDEAYIHSSDVYPEIFDLQDGTYLLTGLNWPGLVRFRGALDSPCIDNSNEVLVVPATWGRDLYEKALLAARERKKNRPPNSPRDYLIDMSDADITQQLREMIKAAQK